MSDNKKPTGVGYRKPPVEHQFAKGKSGNPRGRPPKRNVALLPREVRRALLQVGDMPVQVATPQGKKWVPAFHAVYLALWRKAMSGQISSIRLFAKLHRDAIEEHYRAHPEFEWIEENERDATQDKADDLVLDFLNSDRLKTRKNTV